MLLTEIRGVSAKTAERLSNNGFKVAESVAYAPIYNVTSIDEINATVYANAQRLVEQQSAGSDFLRNRDYWCNDCEHNSVFGSRTFPTYSAIVSHHDRCEGSNPSYDFH